MNNIILSILNYLIFYIISHHNIIIQATTNPWPGSQGVTVVDIEDYFGENLSGLFYEEILINKTIINYLWAVKNNPSILYKLYWNGSVWSSYTEDGWNNGKQLLFSNGKGSPDSEDLTKIKIPNSNNGHTFSNDIYICIERNNNDKDVSLLMVLLYKLDYSSSSSITAYYEWDLTNKLPKVDSNKGFEGITWIPDSFLVLKGLLDQNTKNKYDPLRYSDHGSGLFFLALEDNSMIYAFALNNVTGDSFMINSFLSEESSISGLYFDHDVGQLWTQCSVSCNGIQHVFMIINGNFHSIGEYYPPNNMDNYKNEGFTIVPESQCNPYTNTKQVYWSDDGNDNLHAIRQGTIQCGLIF